MNTEKDTNLEFWAAPIPYDHATVSPQYLPFLFDHIRMSDFKHTSVNGVFFASV